MVKIFGKSMFVGDYGLTIGVETDLGLITLTTDFPRLNKWISVRSVRYIEVRSDEKIYGTGDTKLHVRDPQTFLHKLLMTAKFEDNVQEWQTWSIIMKYRKEHGQT